MDVTITLDKGKFVAEPVGEPKPLEDRQARLESPAGIMSGFTKFEFGGVPVGSGVIAGTWADLISAVAARLPSGLASGTIGTLLAAFGSVWLGKRLKFVGHQIGRDAALVLVANAARPYTAPLIAPIVGMIPNLGGSANLGQGAALAQANQVAGNYYDRTRAGR